ncbi:MAG: polyprenyl synthetase family protein [Clostridiales bacterium]|nr:polyprenyl synthetase family protein [Clostridiales bacterium]
MLELYGPCTAPLQDLEEGLRQILISEEKLVQDLNNHLLSAPGKRIRPALFFLTLNLWQEEYQPFLPVATAIELIHTATLVHDDVIDDSGQRRGSPTINAKWGNYVSVLTGDYLFAKAFALLTEFGDLRIIQHMAGLVVAMSEGEIQQQSERFHPALETDAYYKRIGKKTAHFFTVSAQCGGLISGADNHSLAALRSYGFNLGMAFQIIDDLLDFTGDTKLTGKPTAGDLRQGVVTLPLIHLMKESSNGNIYRKRIAAKEIDEQLVLQICTEINNSQIQNQVRAIAKEYINNALQALQSLPGGTSRNILEQVTAYVLERRN